MRRNKTQVNIRRLCALLFALTVLLGCLPVAFAAETSGSCGDNLSWSYSDGTLTITGSGQMQDYSYDEPAPWSGYSSSIVTLDLPQGLTSVGSYAFAECTNLKAVTLPDSVTRVGQYAFSNCVNMTMLDLGSGLETIEESAFMRCQSLSYLTLPDGLESIGFQAFYRCYSLTAVTVPSSVTEMGMTVFAYCENLVYADIQARISALPQWTFFGCDNLGAVNLPDSIRSVGEYAFHECENLTTVRYSGSDANASNIVEDIQTDLPGFTSVLLTDVEGNSGTVTTIQTTGSETVRDMTTVTQTGNATVGTVVTQDFDPETGTASGWEVKIDAAVENGDGWQDVLSQVEEMVQVQSQYKEGGTVYLTVATKDQNGLSSDVFAQLAGKSVILTVNTPTGASWTVDCAGLDTQNLAENYDLSYTLAQTELTQPEAQQWYALHFNSAAQVNAEILILLPSMPVRQNATLYQKKDGDMELVQTVLVDDEGYAHFYLASVDDVTEYFIGINVTGQTAADAIVPRSLTEQFNIADTMAPIDYEITGIKSSWGMDIGQVTWILVAVLIGSVAIIGVVLFVLNKRKLKKGYVPDLDEYDLK